VNNAVTRQCGHAVKIDITSHLCQGISKLDKICYTDALSLLLAMNSESKLDVKFQYGSHSLHKKEEVTFLLGSLESM